MSFGKTTPILRIFDEHKAKEFYVGFLGFTISARSLRESADVHECYEHVTLRTCHLLRITTSGSASSLELTLKSA